MALVPIISQTWDTTSVFNPTRMNNIEQNLAIVSDATGVKYANGVSVKDKIDELNDEATWTFGSYQDMATYTLNDTTMHNVSYTATHSGLLVLLYSTGDYSLDLFCKFKGTKNKGFAFSGQLPAYYGSEPLFTLPVKTGDGVQFAYRVLSTARSGQSLILREIF